MDDPLPGTIVNLYCGQWSDVGGVPWLFIYVLMFLCNSWHYDAMPQIRIILPENIPIRVAQYPDHYSIFVSEFPYESIPADRWPMCGLHSDNNHADSAQLFMLSDIPIIQYNI